VFYLPSLYHRLAAMQQSLNSLKKEGASFGYQGFLIKMGE
jgi:hypothetical protein